MLPMEIRDAKGNIIHRSNNLAGIRRFVARNPMKYVDIRQTGRFQDEGQIIIRFENDDSFIADFASFKVLCQTLKNWRNLYGVPLKNKGKDEGTISAKNEFLCFHSIY